MLKILIASIFLATSASIFAANFVAKAVYTNNVTQLVTANHEVYVQRVGGAMINPATVHRQVWLYGL